MLSLVYYDNRDIRLEERATPTPGEGELLLKVTDAGLCQTQINEFMEGPNILNREPNPLTGKALPLIAGHEFGGRVEAVGAGVDPALTGQQVAVLPLISCGQCEWCKRGEEQLCESFAYYGLTGADGGFAEYAVVGAGNVMPVADRSCLTFVEPLLVGVHFGRRLESELSGSRVLVLGAGTLGIAVAVVLEQLFGAVVEMNEILPERTRRAAGAGFNVVDKFTLQPASYDFVIDCAGTDTTGARPAFTEAQDYLGKRGTLVAIGIYFHPLSVETLGCVIQEQRIMGTFGYNTGDAAWLAARLAGLEFDFSSVIDEIELKSIVSDGYYRGEVDKDSFSRLVVRC